MNIVTIDPSLSCTAVVINDIKYVYVNENIALTKSYSLTKWFEECSPLVNINLINYENANTFSASEAYKIKKYDEITDKIILDINKNLKGNKNKTYIGIEGYSYQSNVGPLIDLVTFGTLLRKKLLNISTYMEVIPPSKLKLYAAKLTYPPIEKSKKVEWRNSEGISGGSFDKFDMYKVLTENSGIVCDWTIFLRTKQIEILELKNIPKPIEDINDAKILYEVINAGVDSTLFV